MAPAAGVAPHERDDDLMQTPPYAPPYRPASVDDAVQDYGAARTAVFAADEAVTRAQRDAKSVERRMLDAALAEDRTLDPDDVGKARDEATAALSAALLAQKQAKSRANAARVALGLRIDEFAESDPALLDAEWTKTREKFNAKVADLVEVAETLLDIESTYIWLTMDRQRVGKDNVPTAAALRDLLFALRSRSKVNVAPAESLAVAREMARVPV